MKAIGLVCGGLLLTISLASQPASAQTASAELRNSQGDKVGSATLVEGPQGVKITLEASNVPQGRHAFHIHTVGQCEPPAFTPAGGHFTPHGKKHGLMSPEGPHAGDLPNLVVGPDGAARVEVYAAHVTLGSGTHSLFHPGGTAVIVHADPDDEKSDPTGNAGGRIACGIVTR